MLGFVETVFAVITDCDIASSGRNQFCLLKLSAAIARARDSLVAVLQSASLSRSISNPKPISPLMSCEVFATASTPSRLAHAHTSLRSESDTVEGSPAIFGKGTILPVSRSMKADAGATEGSFNVCSITGPNSSRSAAGVSLVSPVLGCSGCSAYVAELDPLVGASFQAKCLNLFWGNVGKGDRNLAHVSNGSRLRAPREMYMAIFSNGDNAYFFVGEIVGNDNYSAAVLLVWFRECDAASTS